MQDSYDDYDDEHEEEAKMIVMNSSGGYSKKIQDEIAKFMFKAGKDEACR